MNNKRGLFLVCVICGLLTAFCLLPSAVSAQAPPDDGEDILLGRKTAPEKKEQAGMPALQDRDLLNIRNLQYDQLRRLLEMNQIAARYNELKNETQGFQQALSTAIEAAAKAAKVDLTKWTFDADSLKFVERPKTKDQRPKTKDQ